MSMHEGTRDPSRSRNRKATDREGDISPRDLLNNLIDDEILPKLVGTFAASKSLNAGANGLTLPSRPSSGSFSTSDVEALYLAVLGRSAMRPEQVIAEVNTRRPACSEVLEGLLRPVANRLGEGWLADDCSFFDVTVGMSKLYQLLHLETGRRTPVRTRQADSVPTILLAGAPGEQHLFGLGVVEQGFIAAGWRVIMMAGAEWPEVCDELRNERCDLLGVTCAGDRLQPTIKSAIDEARLASANGDIKVIVGGHLFLNDGSLASLVGADAAAGDSVSAVALANRLMHVDDEAADTLCMTTNALS
jgi:methanogenic corrinoid protein MtbC1